MLLACLCLSTNAQTFDPRLDYSPYGLGNSMLSLKMRLLSHHGDATQITYFDLNFVEQLMQDFMRNEMGMTTINSSKFVKHDGLETFTITYAQMATMGTKVPHLCLTYTFFTNKYNDPIIKSLNISGTSNKVVYFYAAYWPTTMNFDGSKHQIAFNYLLQDKATIKVNSSGNWNISIENTTIHDLKEYYRELDQNINHQTSLETAYSLKTKRYSDSARRIETRDSTERDSLIKVAKAYKIPFGQQTNLSPTLDWLRTVIANTNNRLSTGNNYNYNSMDSLLNTFDKSVAFDKSSFLSGSLIFKIDESGQINSIDTYDVPVGTSQSVIDGLNKFFIGKKIQPFTFAGKNYSSYKKYKMSFMPHAMAEIHFGEVGDR